jgi:hypothetical protein
LADAPNSYAALVDEWTAPLARAELGGSELAADCVDAIEKFMDGAWASAESIGVAALKGSHYSSSLFDGDIPEVGAFRTFQEGLGPIKNMLKRYKRSVQAMMAPIFAAGRSGTAATGGGRGAGGVAGGDGGGPPDIYKMPAPGSKVAACVTVDGWTCATEFGDRWYHINNCKALAETKFGCKDACVMCVVATGGVKGREEEYALSHCSKNHKVGAPQHALLAKRAEFIAAIGRNHTAAAAEPASGGGKVREGRREAT